MKRTVGVIGRDTPNNGTFKRSKKAQEIAREQHREKIKEEEKLPGRPSKYTGPDTDRMAFKLALLGVKDMEIADIIGISEETLNLWKLNHPSFLQSLNNGKREADANVVYSLYQRACGMDLPDQDIRVFRNKETNELETVVTPLVKHYPPDITACIFWLKNRFKDQWRDVYKTEIGTKDDKPILHDHRHLVLDLSKLSDKELEMAENIGMNIKQIPEKV